MAVAVHLPKVGMTMEEGVLTRWLVADGASVERGQPLFELETEKVELEVEADGDGVLRQLVAEGAKLEPGAVVGCLLAPGESEVPREILDGVGRVAGAPAEAGAPASQPTSQPTAAADAADAAPDGGERVFASPIARRLAAEHGIDLARVPGTGPNGRVTEADVRQRIEAHAGPAPEREPAAAVEAVEAAGALPYSGRRRVIGERMRESLAAMAQLTLSADTRVDDAMRMLHGLNREWRAERVVATLTALVVKACAMALREHPRLNARLDGDTIVLDPAINVGFAVDLDEGLIVPVVREADALSLQDVARSVAALTQRAKDGELGLDDVTGGSFTVTSLEAFAVDAFTPVINPPQAAILGVGRVREVPAFEGSQVVRAQTATLSLTFDHRLVDGAPAARFLGRVCELLGRPYALM